MSGIITIKKVKNEYKSVTVTFPDGFGKWVDGRTFRDVTFHATFVASAEVVTKHDGIREIYFCSDYNTERTHAEIFVIPKVCFEEFKAVLKEALTGFKNELGPTGDFQQETIFIMPD
jgi:hypothetical protein